MLDDDDIALSARETTNSAGGSETLFHVQVGRGLVEHENVGVLHADYGTSEALVGRDTNLSNEY